MIEIQIDEEIRKLLPEFALGCLSAEVKVEDSPPALRELLEAACTHLQATAELEFLHENEAIYGTRLAYKALGKEPSRYRPSAEALQRRILQGKGIYFVNNVVDQLNLISIRSGYSIGGWDLGQIHGPVTVGVGKAGEPYETIGRGPMNIEGFPVMRDRKGAFGTPTSDSQRTMVRPETQLFLMAFYAFEGAGELRRWLEEAIELLQTYAGGKHIETKFFTTY